MTRIPRSALLLGLAGLLPFLWGTATLFVPALFEAGLTHLGARFVGPYVQLAYGQVILAFLSGALWGFAARAEGAVAASGYVLSTLPVLWAFLLVGGGPVSAAVNLAAGFIALLGLDYMFWKQSLAPSWWLALRLPFSLVAIACLVVVAL